MTKELYQSIKENMLLKHWFEMEDYPLNKNFFIVHPRLHIVDAAYRIKINDEDSILQWFNNGDLEKLHPDKIRLFGTVPEKMFFYLQVEDYQLIQEKTTHPKEKFYIKS